MTNTETAAATPAQLDEAWGPLRYATAVAEANRLAARKGTQRRPHDSFYAEQLARAEHALDVASAAEAPYVAEWNRRQGWTRAWLCVTSGRGHIHRSHGCSTLRASSLLALVYTLSGADEAAIVDAAGSDACSFCFPSAPVADGIASRAVEALRLAEEATTARQQLPLHEARCAELAAHVEALTGATPDAATAYVEEHRLTPYTGRTLTTKRNVTTAVAHLAKRLTESQGFADAARATIGAAEAAGITEDYRPGLVPAFAR